MNFKADSNGLPFLHKNFIKISEFSKDFLISQRIF